MVNSLLHGGNDVLLEGEGECTEDPHDIHAVETHICLSELHEQTGQFVSPAEEVQHKLKLCKSSTVD